MHPWKDPWGLSPNLGPLGAVIELPPAVHVLNFARSECEISDARTAHLAFCYIKNI